MNKQEAQKKAIHAKSIDGRVGKEMGIDKWKTNPFAKKYKAKLQK